jgi:hypothetical protein
MSTHPHRPITAVMLSALLAAGCAQRHGPHGEAAYRAFRTIAGATSVGVSRVNYSELLQNASSEMLILRDLSTTQEDSSELRHYANALVAYKDAGTLWDSQIENARYDWIPKEQIFLDDPSIATRYGLEATNRRMPYTGTKYQTTPSSSIQAIWERAESKADSANASVVKDLVRVR